MSALPADVQEQIELLQEKRWRLQCRESLVEYARTVPIPGVPQSDNYESLLEAGSIKPKGHVNDKGKFVEWYDGRYDGDIAIPQIETELAEHHLLILDTLQKLVDEELITPEGKICRRVMLFMPPGSAKSTYASVVFPTWFMGNNPDSPIILTGYADLICKKHGKRARQICLSEEFGAIFETGINKETKAANDWALTNGASYYSAGLQSGLTGNRAKGLIWDDPVKGAKAANSEVERRATWEAYRMDARSRKRPDSWEVGIQTRWHEEDLAGMMLPEGWAGESGFMLGKDGHIWYVLCLQAQVETDTDPLGRPEGAYLWTEWFHEDGSPDDYWAPMKLNPREWSSLYQQVPTPTEGDFFKESWVRYYDHLPKDLNYFISADYAVTEKDAETNPDFTSIGVWGVDSEGHVYFVAGWHGMTDALVWTETMLDFVAQYEPMAHVAGKGPIRRATEPVIKLRMKQRKVFCQLVWYEESYTKDVNARAFQAAMANGMILWPRNDEEANWVIRHLLGFGTLKVDDPVDMCAMIGRHVAKLWGPRPPKEPEAPPVISKGEVQMGQYIKRRRK